MLKTYHLCSGAAYAASTKYWQHLYGLKGLHNYGADEQYISLKAWLEGGRCTLLKDVIIGHIYRKKAPYLILGRDTVYNLMYIAKLLFPPNMYSKTVATSLSLYRDFANEALETFKKIKQKSTNSKSALMAYLNEHLTVFYPCINSVEKY